MSARHALPVIPYARGARRHHPWVALAWLCALHPLLLIGSVYANGICVRLSLGHWPRTCIDAGVPALDELTQWLLVATFPMLQLNAGLAVAATIVTTVSDEPPRRHVFLAFVLPLVTRGLTLVLAAWDPVGVFEWFLD